jgi:hypothetical protein
MTLRAVITAGIIVYIYWYKKYVFMLIVKLIVFWKIYNLHNGYFFLGFC